MLPTTRPGKFPPTSSEVVQRCPKAAEHLRRFRPEVGHRFTEVGRSWSKLGRSRPKLANLGQVWPMVAKVWPMFGRHWPLRPQLAKARFGQICPNVARIWPTLAHFDQHISEVGSRYAEITQHMLRGSIFREITQHMLRGPISIFKFTAVLGL